MTETTVDQMKAVVMKLHDVRLVSHAITGGQPPTLVDMTGGEVGHIWVLSGMAAPAKLIRALRSIEHPPTNADCLIFCAESWGYPKRIRDAGDAMLALYRQRMDDAPGVYNIAQDAIIRKYGSPNTRDDKVTAHTYLGMFKESEPFFGIAYEDTSLDEIHVTAAPPAFGDIIEALHLHLHATPKKDRDAAEHRLD